MATTESVKRSKQRREEALKKNPLLRLDLGDLVREMNVLSNEDENVLKSKEEVPQGSMKNYIEYQSLIKELNRRERTYTSYRGLPGIG